MEFTIQPDILPKSTKKEKKKRVPREPLPMFYAPDKYEYEIGIDEAGRGPLFGRLYVAAVVLPKDGSMNTEAIRDSKKISKRHLPALYDYIKQHALAYYIHYIDASEIDRINIREAVVKAMHICAEKVINQLELKMTKPSDDCDFQTHIVSESGESKEKYLLMVDGNDFPPYYHITGRERSTTISSCRSERSERSLPVPEFLREDDFPKDSDSYNTGTRISYQTFLQGDNAYANIAAASILAKVARDDYVIALCKKYPILATFYGMHEHMGYGTKKHLEAIQKYGITQFHRRTYGCCKDARMSYISHV